MSVKQVLVWNKSLKVRRGKESAQLAHASLKAILDLGKMKYSYDDGWCKASKKYVTNVTYFDYEIPMTKDIDTWLNEGYAKIVVHAPDENEIIRLYKEAKDAGLPCALIEDEGRTEFHGVKTITCCAIGPGNSEIIDKITGDLKLL